MNADTDYVALLAGYGAWDWLYARRYTVLHGPIAATYDAERWCARDVTFACGWTVPEAFIPGIFSRMGLKRCSRCCDKFGYPRGVGSPKNDPECRRILGIDQ